jgi:oligopeptide/dipeptide ABC transporter ATP-binding protein
VATVEHTRSSSPDRDGITPVLEVRDLEVKFFTRRGVVHAVRNVSFSINGGEVVGLVGESGSGKSVTSQAILGLTELPGRITGGDILWKGSSLLQDGRRTDIDRIRGKELSIIFQDPMTSLNHVFTIGTQLCEVMRRHLGYPRRQARERAMDLLDMVGISHPAQRLKQYPHEFSGGMRQRVLIAMALACEPEMLIADEPTTALDVTIQAQILELLADLQERLSLSILLITHDLGVVAGLCDRVAVMYGGKVVEVAPAADLYADAAHPYAAGLLRSTPRLDVVEDRLKSIEGSPPDLVRPPAGCPYTARCESATQHCAEEMPALVPFGPKRAVACWHPRSKA